MATERNETREGFMTEAEQRFVEQVMAYAASRYETGGDSIVECFEPGDIVQCFRTMASVKTYIDNRYDRLTEAREYRRLAREEAGF